MKLSNQNIVLTFIALLISPASGQEVTQFFVRTVVTYPEPISDSQVQAIDAAIKSIEPTLDNVVNEIIDVAPLPPARNLRSEDRKLACHLCPGYAAHVKACFVNGRWWDHCGARMLSMHEELSEEEVASLSEGERRRHLQMSELCDEAKTEVKSTIINAKSEGTLPIPENSTVTETCFYEVAN